MNHRDTDAHEALADAARRTAHAHLDERTYKWLPPVDLPPLPSVDDDGMPLRGRGPLAPHARPPLVHLAATASVLAVTVASVLLFLGAWIDSAPIVIAGGAIFAAALLTIVVITVTCDRERP